MSSFFSRKWNSVWLTLCLIMTCVTSLADDIRSDGEIRSSILDLQIKDGPWVGALKDHPDGAGFRHYFVSDALRSVANETSAADIVESYLDSCLRIADPQTGLWDDVTDVRSPKTKIVDADDSNASLFLLLATQYQETPHGARWWTKHSSAICRIADQVLLDNQLPSGLVTVFSKRRNFAAADRTPIHLALQRSCYLMDSCEVYAALAALGQTLQRTDDPRSPRYVQAARRVAGGIRSLWNEPVGAFYILDGDRAAFPDYYPAAQVVFYPHRLAQVFPQLFDVPLGTPAETRKIYERAWTCANANHDWQAALIKDGSSSDFPMMIRGLVALKRGDTPTARSLIDWYDAQRVLPENVNFRMIQEMGAALRVRQGLQIRP